MSAESGVHAGAIARVERPPRGEGGLRFSWLPVLIVLWLAIAAAFLAYGAGYYGLPLQERPFSAQHELLAPTGLIGHSLGLVGSLFMVVGVAMYSIRKRVRALSGFGRLSHWLRAHIFLCTMGPFLVLLHTSFRFGGLVSIAFWSMSLVVLSGVFGRYVYARIPKTVNGQFRTLEVLESERRRLVEGVAAMTGVAVGQCEAVLAPFRSQATERGGRALIAALRWDLGSRRRARAMAAWLEAQRVTRAQREALLSLMREGARVEQQIALLQPFHRLFRYWHVFHLPLAILMFVILAVHVGVAVAFGYGLPF